MKVYANSVATTSRAVLAFCKLENLEVEFISIDLMEGEHHRPPFTEINPNRLLPVLDDDGFVLTESSAILRYLACKTGSALYPETLQERARVDEMMAWFEANFYKDFGFNFVYPQLFPHHSRGSSDADHATVQFGLAKAQTWLATLDRHFLQDGRRHLVGDRYTIADLHGASILSLGDLIGCCLTNYPNVAAWYETLGEQPWWREVNAPFTGFARSLSEREFVRLS